jgi:hypothetical protein
MRTILFLMAISTLSACNMNPFRSSYKERYDKAAQTFCIKVEFCTKLNYQACKDTLDNTKLDPKTQELELEKLIAYTNMSTCDQIRRFVELGIR